MTVAIAKAIRDALKRAGFTARVVSVRNDSYSMGSSVDVTIKKPSIPLQVIEGIVTPFQRVDRDESGEILSGGNTFVHVKYGHDVLRAVEATVAEQLSQGRNIFGSLRLVDSGQDPDDLFVWDGSAPLLRLSRRYHPAAGLARVIAATGQLECLNTPPSVSALPCDGGT